MTSTDLLSDPVVRPAVADIPQRAPDLRRVHCVVATEYEALKPHLDAWSVLSDTAADGNFYLSPSFLMSAIQFYGSDYPYYVLFVYLGDHEETRELIGVAAFSEIPKSSAFGATTLSTFRNPHKYLSQPLLHAEHAARAIQTIWDWVENPVHPWRALTLRLFRAESVVWSTVRSELSRRRRRHWVSDVFARAKLRARPCFNSYLESLPRNRRKNWAAKLRKLKKRGAVDVHFHRHANDAPELAQRFMALEAASWKGENGTALLNCPSDRDFFHHLVAASCASGKLFCVEITLDDRPIAMSANFVSNGKLFAFKVAYDPDFAEFSPGVLVELETIRLMHETPGLATADGGTNGRSYLDGYWREKEDIQHVLVSTGGVASELYVALVSNAARMKRAARAAMGRLRRRVPQ